MFYYSRSSLRIQSYPRTEISLIDSASHGRKVRKSEAYFAKYPLFGYYFGCALYQYMQQFLQGYMENHQSKKLTPLFATYFTCRAALCTTVAIVIF